MASSNDLETLISDTRLTMYNKRCNPEALSQTKLERAAMFLRAQESLNLPDHVISRATSILDEYAKLDSTKRANYTLTQGGAPFDAVILRGVNGATSEQFIFDAQTGLLMRRVTRTDTALGGSLVEQTDYTQYRPEAGVLTPHKIIRSNWHTYDTF